MLEPELKSPYCTIWSCGRRYGSMASARAREDMRGSNRLKAQLAAKKNKAMANARVSVAAKFFQRRRNSHALPNPIIKMRMAKTAGGGGGGGVCGVRSKMCAIESR